MNYSDRTLVKSWIVMFLIGLFLGLIIMFIITRLMGVQKVQAAETSTPTPISEPINITNIYEPSGDYVITAYCGCKKCCGVRDRSEGVKGAAGIELKEGVSVAVPGLPFGTQIDIEGMGSYIVQDRTAQWIADKYDGKIIDIYFTNHADALNFGKQVRNVMILKGGEKL